MKTCIIWKKVTPTPSDCLHESHSVSITSSNWKSGVLPQKIATFSVGVVMCEDFFFPHPLKGLCCNFSERTCVSFVPYFKYLQEASEQAHMLFFSLRFNTVNRK